MKNLLSLIVIVTVLITTLSFIFPDDPKKVPEKYEKLTNPVKADVASIKSGRDIYISQCRSCHGTMGKGDGNRAAYLDPPPANFTTPLFQSQSDGAILYKIFFIHKDISSLKKRILENDNDVDNSFGSTNAPGDLVNFLRTLAK